MRRNMRSLLTLLVVVLDVWSRSGVAAKVPTMTPVSMLSRGDEQVVGVGSKVYMNCEFTMEEFNMFENPVVWVKYQQNERTNINIMGSVQEPFASTRRYDSTLTKEHPRYIAQLRIKDTNEADTGNYTCELRDRKSFILGQVSYSLHVLAPIKFLSIVLDRRTFDLETQPSYLTLTEGHSVPLKCSSHGGYPPPEITLFLGDKEITDRFRISHNADVTGPKGLRVLHYRTNCWTNEFKVTAADDRKVLQCIANIRGIGTNVTNSTIFVNYAPNITCDLPLANIGDREVQLHCIVRSRPLPTSLYWYMDANMTIAPSGNKENDFVPLVRDRDDGVLEVILFIKQVDCEDFRRYSLVAENKIGMTSYEMELRQRSGSDSTDCG